jgi:hypothetical protein
LKKVIRWQILLLLQVFGNAQAQFSVPPVVYHCDVNNDGFEDIWIETYTNSKQVSTKEQHRIITRHFFYGHANGIGTVPDRVYSISTPLTAYKKTECTDVNRDGIPDSAVTKGSTVLLYAGSKNGYSSIPTVMYKLNIPDQKEWTSFFYDYNGDDVTDLIICTFHPLHNLSTVTKKEIRWQVVPGLLSGWSDHAIDIPELNNKDVSFLQGNDFNHDGREDLFLIYMDASLHLCNEMWMGCGEGAPYKKAWKRWKIPVMGGKDYKFTQGGDVNGDGQTDLLVLKRISKREARRQHTTPNQILFYTGTKEGLSDTPFCVLSLNQTDPFYYYSVNVLGAVDVNGDGFEDCILSGSDSTYMIVWGGAQMLSVTTYPFSEYIKEAITESPTYRTAGDVNSDGMDDLILFYKNRSWVLYGTKTKQLKGAELQLK